MIWSALIFTDRTINVRSCCGEWSENTDDPQDVATRLVRRVVPCVVIGQFGVDINSGIKSIFFALFIYAVGFQGGPQFFHALSRRSLNQLASAFVMCFTGLLCVLVAAWMFGLDRGIAAGLAAGGLTQSAIIGTAGDAIGKLGLSPELIKTMQTNVAVGYAVCYIFGSLGPIIMISWFLPLVMKWDIREQAVKLANLLSGGHPELDPGQFNAAQPIATRIYEIAADSKAAGKTALAIDQQLSDVSVEAIYREGKAFDLTDATIIGVGDRVAVTGMGFWLVGLVAVVLSDTVGATMLKLKLAVIAPSLPAVNEMVGGVAEVGVQSGGGSTLTV